MSTAIEPLHDPYLDRLNSEINGKLVLKNIDRERQQKSLRKLDIEKLEYIASMTPGTLVRREGTDKIDVITETAIVQARKTVELLKSQIKGAT